MITSVKYVNDNFALKSNVITEEQLIKKCAIDCGPITEGGEISIHYLKLEDKVIKLEYIVGDYALCLEIRILFYDTTGNPQKTNWYCLLDHVGVHENNATGFNDSSPIAE